MSNIKKSGLIEGKPLNPNLSAANRYEKRLDKLINVMIKDVEKELKVLFKERVAKQYFTQDASISSQARIVTNALIDKYEALFAQMSKPLAENVAEEANKSSSQSIGKSLKDIGEGFTIKVASISKRQREILNAAVTENVALIKSIPQKYLNGVQQAVMRSIVEGQGLKDLIPYLDKHKSITKRRAKMIAYDQTRKTFNGLNRQKMKDVGFNKFKWLHSGGSKEPRKLHQELSGNVYPLDEPEKLPIIDKKTGQRGFPGDLPNCRCRAVPVIELGD